VIGVLTTSYPRSPGDYAGVFVRERVRALHRDGQQVELIAAADGPTTESEAITSMRLSVRPGGLFYAGGAPERLQTGAHGPRWRAFLDGLHFSVRMAELVRQRQSRWNAVESHWLVPCAVVACAVAPRLPHRAHAHGGDVFLLSRLPGGASLARALCRPGTHLVFASTDLRTRFARLCGQPPEDMGARVSVEPAPYDRELFYRRSADDRDRARRRLGLTGPTLLAAGRLVPIKGFDVLIAALGRLPAARRPRLLLAGDGPEAAALRRLAIRTGVTLQFLGTVAQPALAEWMNAADIFVHPCRGLADGRTEGAPLVVREALACELPVIASASGGLPEQIHPLLTLVPPDDVEALAAALAGRLTAVTLIWEP
jgi:glycosyltransferase involved in cell wall biosynthesis